MRKAIRTVALGLVLSAIGVSPGLAQSLEKVKVVFEHAIPNIKGKSVGHHRVRSNTSRTKRLDVSGEGAIAGSCQKRQVGCFRGLRSHLGGLA